MSPATRIFAGILLLSILTIEFGGRFLLQILRGRTKIARDGVTFSLFRAGHAHAGVLVILALVAMPYVDAIQASEAIKMTIRVAFGAAPILMSAGFFAAGGTAKDEKPGGAIVVTYVGAIVLAVGLALLGVDLFLA